MNSKALLALEDGTVLVGRSIGAAGTRTGEVVFNTAMTGYQEILTDPSYARQFVTLTYPHIGNVGTNPADAESDRVHAAGLVIRDLSPLTSSWRSGQSLPDYLAAHEVVAIAGVDTRRLTRRIREQGAQNACLTTELDAEAAVARAREFPGLKGMDLAAEVSTPESLEWTEGAWQLEGDDFRRPDTGRYHVIAYDFGIKRNILRRLAELGARVTVVPARTPAADVLKMSPDGVFLSNGPGDPEPCDYAIRATREFLDAGIPLFGICLGHQLLGLAAGARSVKMKFGHHGANHPVVDLDSRSVLITSQNHGFAIEEDSLPQELRATHRSLFDDSLQGIEHTRAPAFGFQGHPEASPGPHDARVLFEKFATLMDGARQQAAETVSS